MTYKQHYLLSLITIKLKQRDSKCSCPGGSKTALGIFTTIREIDDRWPSSGSRKTSGTAVFLKSESFEQAFILRKGGDQRADHPDRHRPQLHLLRLKRCCALSMGRSGARDQPYGYATIRR